MSIEYSLSNSEECYPSYLSLILTMKLKNKSIYIYAENKLIYKFANIPQNQKNKSIYNYVNIQISS